MYLFSMTLGNHIWGLCKKVFYGASRQIMFCETRHFNDFAKRNR